MIKNIGIVGTGDIAAQFVTQIDTKKYNIHSVFNRTSRSLINFTQLHDLTNGYTDYMEFLDDDALECVYIATPNQTHFKYAKEALEKGKHVLCEKVLVLTASEAKELYRLAKEKNLVILEAVTLFYMPLYEEVKRLMRDGVLGQISGANITFGSCKEYDINNRFFSLEKGGGALFDIGPYGLSAAVYLLGTDLDLVATSAVMAKSGVDEKSVTILQNPQGQQASIQLSFRGKMPKQIVLTGDEGYLIINDFPRAEVGVVTFNDGSTKVIEKGHAKDVFTYEMDMLNHLAKRPETSEVPDVRDVSLRVLELMDDMRESWGYKLFK